MKMNEKQQCIKKLMVIALNEAIGEEILSLAGLPGGSENAASFAWMKIGGRPTIFNWFDAGYDELRVSIWWDYQPHMMPVQKKKSQISLTTPAPDIQKSCFPYILGACGSCYFERRSGKFIAGEEGRQFFNVYVRESSLKEIADIASEQPKGYATSGWIRD